MQGHMGKHQRWSGGRRSEEKSPIKEVIGYGLWIGWFGYERHTYVVYYI